MSLWRISKNPDPSSTTMPPSQKSPQHLRPSRRRNRPLSGPPTASLSAMTASSASLLPAPSGTRASSPTSAATITSAAGISKFGYDTKKQRRPLLTQFFSHIFLKGFSITFFGERGDKSQIATIELASDVNPYAVVLGRILGQVLCTTATVLGGKS